MTPLERAAHALCVNNKYVQDCSDPDSLIELETVAWEDLSAEEQQAKMSQARALLTAIREPTHGMQAAAFAQKVSFRSGSGMSDVGQVSVEYEGEPDKGAATLWQAMIDAMLEEGA